MLRRFEWIQDGGYFNDYRWDATLPEFKRINVVYGSNGSGKSSLARVLDGLRSTPDGFRKASVVLEQGGNRRATNGRSDPAFDRVLVFNEDYVARSHRFRDGLAEADAVLTLGQRTAEDEERLDELRKEQRTLLVERQDLGEDKKRCERDLDRSYTRVSHAIVRDAQRAGGIYASHSTYSVVRVKARLAELGSRLVALPPEELAAKQQLISGGNKELLTTRRFSLAVRDDMVDTAQRLLVATPVTIVLDTLQAHPEASGWVQEGVRLHGDTSTCSFCGGELSDARKHLIEQHFSDEVAQVQRRLGDLAGELDEAVAAAEDMVHTIPTSGLLFDDLRLPYEQAAQAIREQVVAFKMWSGDLRSELTTKQANVLATVECHLTAPPVIDGTALAKIRDDHNQRVAEHDQLVQEAARAIELHQLQVEEGPIAGFENSLSGIEKRLTEIEDRLGELATEIPGLETAEGDPTPTAQVLTKEVARLLGRRELTFEATGKRYRVLRDGAPANGLSVGERTAVTLVHFLETVARFDAGGGKPIVVIDDPVSSLDSNVFLGISTYIWSSAISLTRDHIGQLFLLTHNFDLFRQWDIQLENLHKGKGMQQIFPAAMYELRARHVKVAERSLRRPAIAAWPESMSARRKMRSSYHHAFLLMAEAHDTLQCDDTVEHRLDAQMLFPNLIRRVLESFLAFKRPGKTGDFTAAMRETTAMLECAGYPGDAEALRQQLTRYTHAYSHSETPDTNEVISPDEIAGALVAVFAFMRQLDEGHFLGLCEVVGVKPDALAPPTLEEAEVAAR